VAAPATGGTAAATGGTSSVTTGGTTGVATGGTTSVATGGKTAVATGGTITVVTGGTSAVATGGAPGVGGASTGVTSITVAEACTNTSQPLGLSMYILQDATASMTSSTASGESKWDAITAAISAFVVDVDSANISGGIGFFTIETGSDYCALSNYTTPAVAVGKLSTTGSAIVNAINKQSPDAGETATPVALQGALTYARTVATARAGTDRVVVVLATDGQPNDCYTSDPYLDTSAAAAAGFSPSTSGTPSIPTYVLGVVSASSTSDLDHLNAFAQSGGTGTAFVVDTSGTGANKTTRALFGNAMSQIRDANLQSCTVALPSAPAGKAIDSTRASLEYTVGGTTTTLAWRASSSACDATAGGFYYDNNQAPTSVALCPATCKVVQNGVSGALAVRFGCKTAPAGGTGGASGTGGAENRGPVCLLPGQYCSSSALCCSKVCSGSMCG
jgi:hypothetical protein